MADQNSKKILNLMKISSKEFERVLLSNPKLNFENSKCLIQYGEEKL